MAAGETEREASLEQLQTCLTTVAALSERALASDNAAQQRFGALLAKAFQFPAANYVYLVGGLPIITFWGFINIDQKPRTDALECLREALPVITSQPLVDPIAPPIAQPNAAAVYAETASLPVEPDNEPDDAPKVAIPPVPSASQGKSALRRWWWAAPGVALAGALVWQFRAGAPSQPITAEPVVAHTPEKRVLPATEKAKEAETVAQNATPIAPPPVAAETPPEAVKAPVVAHPETAPVVAQKPAPTPSTPPVETVVAEVKPEEAKPVDKNALVMPITPAPTRTMRLTVRFLVP